MSKNIVITTGTTLRPEGRLVCPFQQGRRWLRQKNGLQNPANNAIIALMVTIDEEGRFAAGRAGMVRDQLVARDITDQGVLRVMGEVPRELFVPHTYLPQAYADRPLPIGTGQTISQPYIVALMTQHLDLTPDCRVLEIGTGSGYQTAILAKLAGRVYTIEKYNQLSESAQAVLGRLNIENVDFCIGDGSCGWPDQDIQPFDRIIITAAIPTMPKPITDQLAKEGKIIAPTGGPYEQTLTIYQNEKSDLKTKTICQCRFVKLTGKHAFPE